MHVARRAACAEGANAANGLAVSSGGEALLGVEGGMVVALFIKNEGCEAGVVVRGEMREEVVREGAVREEVKRKFSRIVLTSTSADERTSCGGGDVTPSDEFSSSEGEILSRHCTLFWVEAAFGVLVVNGKSSKIRQCLIGERA